MRSDDEAAASLLDFWFGPLDADGLPDRERVARWFEGDAAFDAEIRRRFLELVEDALAGGLGAWEATPRQALALVLALDQLPRNLFRGSSRAFSGDARALVLARQVVAAGWAERLLPVERTFLYLPFEHAEVLTEQERCCALFRELADGCAAASRPLVEAGLAYAERHRVVIERFGRFPARNAALGRPSTRAELAFLAETPTGF